MHVRVVSLGDKPLGVEKLDVWDSAERGDAKVLRELLTKDAQSGSNYLIYITNRSLILLQK